MKVTFSENFHKLRYILLDFLGVLILKIIYAASWRTWNIINIAFFRRVNPSCFSLFLFKNSNL